MSPRLLILEAGGAAGNNLIRSLKAGDPSSFIVGCNESRFFLKKSPADRNYVLPVSPESFGTALRRIVDRERIDLVIPTTDSDVSRLAGLRHALGRRVFLPRSSVIERCQDKYVLTAFLHRRGIAVPLTYPIRRGEDMHALFRRFKRRNRLWCRIRRGAGSFGAIAVKAPEQVEGWLTYWDRMRGIPAESFTLSEYLPGRDYCVQSLWHKGELVLAKMAERITYLKNGGPSGVSSMPALAKTVFDEHIMKLCERAIRALDPRASGVFFVDLKENDSSEPCITEINAGRFATMTNIHDLTGEHNMASSFVKLALGRPLAVRRKFDFAEGYYLVRSVDTLPELVRQEALFEDIEELGL